MGDKPGYTAPAYAQAGMAHAHPGAPGKWTFGLFDCCAPFSTCCMAYWCPCILFGRTAAIEKGDPSGSGLNSSCGIYTCLMCAGVPFIVQCMNRGSMREKYGIEGDSFKDFCTPYCCPCCALVQENKESTLRMTGIDPKTKQQYASPNQMTYP